MTDISSVIDNYPGRNFLLSYAQETAKHFGYRLRFVLSPDEDVYRLTFYFLDPAEEAIASLTYLDFKMVFYSHLAVNLAWDDIQLSNYIFE